jgi:ubiquinone/menaquinone biosynthesis C-methylase UbiE
VTGTLAHPFAERWNHNAHYYPRLAAAVPADAGVVLDIGCGDGTLARYLARPGRMVLGLDPDGPSPASTPAPGVHLAVGTAEELPCADSSVDAVTMVMVLHHTDALRALAEIRRVLRPGGTALVLGYGRSDGPRDAAYELRDLLWHRRLSRRTVAWEPGVAVADPAGTWAEARALLRSELPGGTYRRLPLWRYLYTWRRPR